MKNIKYMDCVGVRCKNLQTINTIEIFYYIDTNDEFAIEYNFHNSDIEIWKQILEIHKDQNDDAILYNHRNEIIEINNIIEKEYHTFSLKSKNSNLYRNINLIIYIDNMDEQIRKNSWE